METILMTGTTSGIGKAMAEELLRKNDTVIMLVRNGKKAEGIFSDFPNARVIECCLEDGAEVAAAIGSLKMRFDAVILAAGGAPLNKEGEAMFNDSQYPGETKGEREQNAYEAMRQSNVRTKETVLDAFAAAYPEGGAARKLVMLGSHASDFTLDDPRRADEEGYVRWTVDVARIAQEQEQKGLFGEVYLLKPGLIKTGFTQNSPFLSKLLETQPYAEADDYAKEALREIGLLA